MRKVLYIISFCIFLTTELLAVPARLTPMRVKQIDGSDLIVYLRGDEFYHYYVTEDGTPLFQGNDQSFYYAVRADSVLVNSGMLAHSADLREPAEIEFLKTNKDEAISVIEEQSKKQRREKLNIHDKTSKKKTTRTIGKQGSFIGKKKGLVILVNFQDCPMSGSNPQNEFNDFFNKIGYNQNGHIGSVHDYYYDQSYGQFELSFDVVGPITVQEPLSYYGSNSMRTGSDMNVGQMVAEACMLTNEFVDFSDYDWNNDGEVEQVFLIYAGHGEADGAPSYTIWPHKFSLTGCAAYGDGLGKLQLDGVTIDTYACSSELAGPSGKTFNGIGTACHEFSHCLGLPDFYDVEYNGGFGMSEWDLMCAGSRNGPKGIGEVPSGYSAYERWYAGWLSFTELGKADRIEDMPCIGDEPLAYILYNDNNENECFVLENRQNKGWFSYVNTSNTCHGLLVYHIDYSSDAWEKQLINVIPNHQRMSVVPADNDYGRFYNDGKYRGYSPTNEELNGDLFPGSKNITEFTNTSHTNVGGKLFNKNTDGSYNLNKPITNITETNGLISFDFMGGRQVAAPVLNDASDIKQDGFTISWTSEIVDSFSLEMNRIADWNLLLTENFAKFKPDSNSVSIVQDLSSVLDFYTQTKGWQGKSIYSSSKGVRIGDDKNQGALKTPAIISESGSITLRGTFSSVKENAQPILITLQGNDGYTIDVHKIQTGLEMTDTTLYFEYLPIGEYFISFSSGTPFYLNNLQIFDAMLTAEDIDEFYTSAYSIRIDGIKETSYTFMNLNPGVYQYRVKAMIDNMSSDWSEYKKVTLQRTNAIVSIPVVTKKPIAIYRTDGTKVDEMKVPGIYILDYGDYKKKVMHNGK